MLTISIPLLLAACAIGNTVAFVPNSNNVVKGPSTISHDPLGLSSFENGEIPYGEESRKYRRTVYSHEDWVKHRSPDRFIKNILSTTKSGIYKVRACAVCGMEAEFPLRVRKPCRKLGI